MRKNNRKRASTFSLIGLVVIVALCISYYAFGLDQTDNNLSSEDSLDSLVSSVSTTIETTVATTVSEAEPSETTFKETTVATTKVTTKQTQKATQKQKTKIPAYSGNPYVALNNNVPEFSNDQYTTKSYETYGKLDSLGRCTMCIACLGRDLMPTGKRGSISSIHPSGWVQARYSIVDSESLYNRCHLIGWQLSGENANERNLITGTRYLNTKGMLPFENMVADYIKETNNHVLYRVTPIFSGNNLVADGVQMEAWSVEDEGDGICFNVYCYNVQPGIYINYATGESHLENESAAVATKKAVKKTTKKVTVAKTEPNAKSQNYILNTNTHKFHYPSCNSVKQMSEKNKQEYLGSRNDLISQGYSPCGNCKP